MSSEARVWQALRMAIFARDGDLKRIENRLDKGTPDVSACLWGKEGWIELKFLRAPPVRPETPVRIDHWTADQVKWLGDRYRAGGRVMILLMVGESHKRCFYCLDFPGAYRTLNREPFAQLRTSSCEIFGPEFNVPAFRRAWEGLTH